MPGLMANILGQEEERFQPAQQGFIPEGQQGFTGPPTPENLPQQLPVQEQPQVDTDSFDPVSSFMKMDIDERRKVLIAKDPVFGEMAAIEQTKVLNTLQDDAVMVATLFGEGKIPKDSPEYNKAQRIYLALEPYIKPVADIAALTAGAAIGAPVGPLGSVGGAALIVGMERSFFKMVEGLLGLREPKGFIQEGQEAVADIQEGAVFEMGGQNINAALKGAGSLIHKIKSKSTLTEAGAKSRADKIIKREIEGHPLAQKQIDQNVKMAKELQEKVRRELGESAEDFTFTMGQLTDDASAVALERTLARRGKGLDLTQIQREYAAESLRSYYTKKVLTHGTPEDLAVYTEKMAKELQASTQKALNAVDAEVLRINRYVEPQVSGTNIHAKLSKGKAEMKATAKAKYDKIPDHKLKTNDLHDGIKNLISSEDKIIEPRTQSMVNLINKHILAKPSAPTITINPATGQKTIHDVPITKDTGFQVLRKLHSRVNRQYRQASSKPDQLEDARQLFELRKLLDSAMDQVSNVSKEAKALYDDATKFYSDRYIQTYRQGTVAQVLKRGGLGEETKIAKSNIAQAFDSPEGIDHLINAVGIDNAKNMMRDYYQYSLANHVVSGVTEKNLLSWTKKHASELKKLGLIDEFKKISDLQTIADNAKKTLDVFNKSVASRILDSDVRGMINNAFKGSKNHAEVAENLMKLVKGNEAAENGLRSAFGEFLTTKAESIQPGFFQSFGGTTAGDIKFLESVAKMNKIFKEFRPAMDVMYKGKKEQLQAIMDVWQGFRILNRTAKSPVGAGSPTAELVFGERAIARTGAAALGGVRPGKLYPWIFINKWIEKHGLANVEKYLTKAMFNPEYAAGLTKQAKEGLTPANIANIDRLMRNIALVSSHAPEVLSGKFKDTNRRTNR